MSCAIVCDDGEGDAHNDCDGIVKAPTAKKALTLARRLGYRVVAGEHVCPVCQNGRTQ